MSTKIQNDLHKDQINNISLKLSIFITHLIKSLNFLIIN